MKQATAPNAAQPQSQINTLYPELPISVLTPSMGTAAPGADQSYRLQEISRLKRRLDDERDKQVTLYKKYRCGVNALDGVDTTLLTAGMGMGIGGVGLLTTIFAAPVVLGLKIAALVCGEKICQSPAHSQSQKA